MAYPQTAIPGAGRDVVHSVFYAHSISANGIEIGSFERFSTRSTRNVERIREIMGSRGPQVKDMVWSGTEISLDVSRVEIYNKAMFEAFKVEIFTLEDFNHFVNIHEFQWNPGMNPSTDDPGRTITFVDCVASDWGKDLDTGTARVVESMTFQVRTIIGTRS